MKTHSHPNPHNRFGFTLIELLVVITIIGILAGLVISQAPAIMKQGRELEVRNVIVGLKTGIANYQVEYNRFPIKSTSSGGDADAAVMRTDESVSLIDILMGDAASNAGKASEAATTLNPKGIEFCNFKRAKNGLNGLVNAQSPYKLVDLWGFAYYVLFDTNLNQQIENPDVKNQDPKIAQSITNPPPQNLPTDVAIYSSGQDKIPLTGDDLVSWRN